MAGAEKIPLVMRQQPFPALPADCRVHIHAHHKKRRQAVVLLLLRQKRLHIDKDIAAEQQLQLFADDHGFPLDGAAPALVKVKTPPAEGHGAEKGKERVVCFFPYRNAAAQGRGLVIGDDLTEKAIGLVEGDLFPVVFLAPVLQGKVVVAAPAHIGPGKQIQQTHMVDVRVGITNLDEQFARMVRKLDKKVILVANKSENGADRQESYEFLKLGFGLPRTISALTGYACLSLMDEVIAVLPTPVRGERREERPIRFAILGRPNAGKSTLLNRLLNEDRAVVSDIPGTTRDSIDCDFAVDGVKFVVTDTAGLRKKAKVEDEVEIFSNMRTLESIRRSDVSVLMVDCTRGLEVQDFRIITEIRKAGKGLVLVLNKWDIFPDKTEKSFDHMVKEMLEREPMLEYVPIISASAKEGQRVNRIVQAIQTVYANCRRVLGRDRVATAFASFLEKNPVPSQNARVVQLTRACQIMVEPPVIAIETRTPELVADSYKRYLLKQFYEEFQLQGAPLRLNFDQKLTLRKDEDLEQFTESSNSVLAGVNPQRDLDRKNRKGKVVRH